MKNCPCCSNVLIPKKVSSHYGVYLEIDQCEHCGGIWFDKYELVSMKPDDVYSLDIDFKDNINCNSLKCPNDGTSLKLLRDPIIPKDVLIYYCVNCFGMWVPIQSLRRYKEYQKERIETRKKQKETSLPKDLDLKIEEILSKNVENNKIENMEMEISKFISIVILILRILSFFIRK
uniref:Transcription factor zinc-finger domain-containing protein n=1 Tax=Dictyoglomus thermophilum TaxID=14 RepID=A0A7C3RWF6_DICTH